MARRTSITSTTCDGCAVAALLRFRAERPSASQVAGCNDAVRLESLPALELFDRFRRLWAIDPIRGPGRIPSLAR